MLVLQVFIMRNGAFEGTEMVSGAQIEIGRDPTCALCLDDDGVSRKHAVLFEHNGQLGLRDLGSANGTRVNGEPVQGSRAIGPRDDIELSDPAWGCDFESEICVVLGDVPQGTTRDEAGKYVRLLMLANDVTLRNLVPGELEKGFGFFQSKPSTAFSPFAVTPDELGSAWRDGRVHLPLSTHLNGALVGDPDAGPEMHFSFFDLIEHIARTRAFGAGTILGSGTVSNADPARGISCLAERRMREKIDHGAPTTPFLAYGDAVRIEMLDPSGRSLFGAIEQKVVPKTSASATSTTTTTKKM